MDYGLEVLKNNLKTVREFNELIFNKMEDESDFIINTLENYQVIFEEAQQVMDSTKQAGFFQRLADFFKRLFGVFSEKTKSIFESNKKWMDDNFNKLDKIDYSNIEIKMVPFWNMSLNRIKADSYAMARKITTIMTNKQTLEKYKDFDTIKKDIYGAYLDDNGDLTNGLKNYYRTGNSKGSIEMVSLKGNTLKEKINEFKTYCFNYGKDIEPFVQNLMATGEKELQRVEKTLKSRPVEENFCLVENTFYNATDVAQFNGFTVLEAEQPKSNDTKKDTSTKPTEVQIVNKDDDKQKEEEDTTNQKYSGLSTNELLFLKNIMQIEQVSISALMTVIEERFKAYMNALKAIIGEGGEKVDNTPNIKETKKSIGGKE